MEINNRKDLVEAYERWKKIKILFLNAENPNDMWKYSEEMDDLVCSIAACGLSLFVEKEIKEKLKGIDKED